MSLALSLLLPTTAGAQTFLDRLQRQQKNQGKVTVTQSAAIDELVNGPAKPAAPAQKPATPKGAKPDRSDKSDKSDKSEKSDKSDKSEKPEKPEASAAEPRQKVMGKSYKVTGYRVQAYAGGNTRADRQRAEQARTVIKGSFPDEPVYVHFYSPRWICRVGNYRTYEEAHQMLAKIRELGYKGATVVKGKITVQY